MEEKLRAKREGAVCDGVRIGIRIEGVRRRRSIETTMVFCGRCVLERAEVMS